MTAIVPKVLELGRSTRVDDLAKSLGWSTRRTYDALREMDRLSGGRVLTREEGERFWIVDLDAVARLKTALPSTAPKATPKKRVWVGKTGWTQAMGAMGIPRPWKARQPSGRPPKPRLGKTGWTRAVGGPRPWNGRPSALDGLWDQVVIPILYADVDGHISPRQLLAHLRARSDQASALSIHTLKSRVLKWRKANGVATGRTVGNRNRKCAVSELWESKIVPMLRADSRSELGPSEVYRALQSSAIKESTLRQRIREWRKANGYPAGTRGQKGSHERTCPNPKVTGSTSHR